MDVVYAIKKTMLKDGKIIHVLLTDGTSEILEIAHENIAIKMVDVLNGNSDSGWAYELIEIKKK